MVTPDKPQPRAQWVTLESLLAGYLANMFDPVGEARKWRDLFKRYGVQRARIGKAFYYKFGDVRRVVEHTMLPVSRTL